uniref:NADH-ubiquinone oxidoreductase chain 2 n=1 Tax=Dinoderus minutus TaxID=1587246 RepID=A0A343C1B2_9COLE|nr:NADH dehydrogenase subunit 2 [Dinoderus minutus]
MSFFLMLIISTMISISSYSWMGMWLGLEINLMSMIPLMINKKNYSSSESSIKYFITQALASSILIMSIMLMETKMMSFTATLFMNSAIMTKMGTAPFHFWFPDIIEGMNWMNCMMLLTWQKVAPMIIFFTNNKSSNIISLIALTSLIIGGISSINQTSLRKIMVYSSINHMGWMMAAMTNELILMFYITIYSAISINLMLFFKKMNLFFLSQISLAMKNNPKIKLMFMMNFMSMGGLPPFLGFIPKWITIQSLIENNQMTLSILMTILTLIMLYKYIQILLPSMTLQSSSLKWKTFIMPKYSLIMNSINLLSFLTYSLWFLMN